MYKGFAAAFALLATLAFGAACTVHKTEAPSLTGPSELGLSLAVTAIPDSISQDGASQSSIAVTVRNANSKTIQGQVLRVDMAVNGTIQDFGTLSARSIVTGSDGIARTIYTAPPPPPPGAGGSGTHVSIVLTPIGSNALVSNPEFGPASIPATVDIRLVPPGVILPPGGTPTAAFTTSPTPVLVNVPVTFDASTSAVGTGATQITSYSWSFGDSTAQGTGRTVTHTFTTAATFNVTLTVVNDRGLSASTTVAVSAGSSAGASPTAKFVFSPTAPLAGQTVQFNADESTAAPGHTLTAFNWNFGDGTTASGFVVSHVFAAAGTFNVVLSVIDDTAQKGTTSVSVVISGTGGGGSSAPTATFTFSPAAPGVNETVFFNASTSIPGTGHSIASYAWTFGDGVSGSGVTASHAYSTSGSYGVQLKVTDEAGQSTTSVATSISVGSPPAPTANFTFSPASPGRFDQVVFDASSSSTAQGQTIVDVAWNFGDGTAVIHCPGGVPADCPGPTNRISAHTFTTNQSFVVNLVVTDTAGRTGSRNTTVTVALAQPTVVITTSPTSPTPGTTVNFNSNGTTYYPGSGCPCSFAWTFGDGGVSALANPTHAYAAVGTYSAQLSVTDNKGRTGTAVATVTVVAVVPPASPVAAFTVSPASPSLGAGGVANFDAGTSLRPSGAAIVNYRWNFGDGTPVVNTALVTFSHTYLIVSPPAGFTVTLIVTDTNALSGSTTQAVIVVP